MFGRLPCRGLTPGSLLAAGTTRRRNSSRRTARTCGKGPNESVVFELALFRCRYRLDWRPHDRAHEADSGFGGTGHRPPRSVGARSVPLLSLWLASPLYNPQLYNFSPWNPSKTPDPFPPT